MTRTIIGADIPGLLAACKVEAFKLDLRDDYSIPGEDDALQRWRRGQRRPGDAEAEGLGPWLDIVRTLTAAGARVRRVRVVTEPTSDYIRFESNTVPMQQAAGEDIRYLPRHHPAAGQLGDRDFWLFDHRQVLVLNFNPDGTPRPHELHDDPGLIAQHAALRDLAWEHAIPYADYVDRLE